MSDFDFTYQTMLTCLGNKRKLVDHICRLVQQTRTTPLCIMDGFTGSGVVARALAPISHTLITCDLEEYAHIMSRCFLETPTMTHRERIAIHIAAMNRLAEEGPFVSDGIISRLYAPAETDNIKEGERCFYTRENAVIIDTMRRYIADQVEVELQHYCLAPLLIKASIHTNTAGVFKGFYKAGKVGCFGGAGRNALSRIMKPIRVDMPVWSQRAFKAECHCGDLNRVLLQKKQQNIDVLYLDPPYNQHPYGSNYFMLNVIAKNEEPAAISRVSGIPAHWNKSAYNGRATAITAMEELLRLGTECATHVILSYNDEGIILPEDWSRLFEPYLVEKHEILYDTYKGSRNLRARDNKVVEIMWVITKKTGV